MKRLGKIMLAVAGCCAIGLAVYTAVQPELSVEATLPDVSVLGIDPNDFTYSGVYYQEIGIGYEWIDSTSEKPCYQWSKYESETGAYLVFDEQNRLRRFVNSSDVRKAQISPDDVLSTDALIEKANAIASELVMNSSAFSVNTEMSAINETKADIVLTCTVSDYVFDAAVIELAQNGSVKKLQFEYCDVPADFTPAALDAVLEDYLLEKVAARYGEDHTDFDISHGYFMSLNNMIYGAYSVTVTYGDLNQYSDVIGVVVYDE